MCQPVLDPKWWVSLWFPLEPTPKPGNVDPIFITPSFLNRRAGALQKWSASPHSPKSKAAKAPNELGLKLIWGHRYPCYPPPKKYKQHLESTLKVLDPPKNRKKRSAPQKRQHTQKALGPRKTKTARAGFSFWETTRNPEGRGSKPQGVARRSAGRGTALRGIQAIRTATLGYRGTKKFETHWPWQMALTSCGSLTDLHFCKHLKHVACSTPR